MKWARRHGKPVVFTVHTKFDEKFRAAFGPIFGKVLGPLLYKSLIRFICEADFITCPGEMFFEALLCAGVPKEKLRIVRNGISEWPLAATLDLSEDPILKRALEARSAGKAILLFVGQLIREKNPHVLLDALAKLKAMGVPFLCCFVGGGDQTRALMLRARKLGVGDDVLFVGRVFDRARLSRFYGLADLMTFPSTFETSGLVLMEAAQHGLATVGITGSSGIGEIVRDGENGFLAPLDPTLYAVRIASALSDQLGLARVRRNARQSLARSKDAMVDEFLGLYSDACVRSSSRTQSP
jgi:glycosyltransferase involved in cell wall biosynthesis